RDHFKDLKTNKAHIKLENAHNPEIEYDEFVKLLRQNSWKSITTDRGLSKILKQDSHIELPVLVK
ncbi:hypothetical protein, partial [Fulvivirga aurantia]|uniref:hypothetical protein n=1 Tax=Fulvivirga aurantia TaxID=2529383 RepID=UPI001CA3AC65